MSRRPYPEATVEYMLELTRMGASLDEIKRLTGMSKPCIHFYRRMRLIKPIRVYKEKKITISVYPARYADGYRSGRL